ncbi:lytic transglycosylase domain-containing protein [Novosphingobium sp. PS1R-30]|uniref:Lytic transglycosylase domain-containing protein n=1 Tax=Novosphingobium anseongense TaxID=3133436 RepID=A0ABU8RW21_9SPHN
MLPSVASADVMEIGVGGHSWVAGGPRAAVVEIAAPSVGDVAERAPDGEPYPLSFTQIGDTAGPAQWQPRVAELAAKYDLSPSLLEAVVWQESRWNTGAVSPVGARGLTQLMPGTARQMGVNPHDPSANLEGGARYLRLQLDAFEGDLEKALAAYNAGPARVVRAGGIPAIRETQLYVSSIMARLSAPVRR